MRFLLTSFPSRARSWRLYALGLALLLAGAAAMAATPAKTSGAKPAAPKPAKLTTPAPEDSSAVAELQRQARAVTPLLTTGLAQAFVAATAELPHVTPRTVLYDSSRTHFWWEEETAGFPDTMRSRLVRRTLDEHFYYNTRYGTPLAYARPLELLAKAGLTNVAGRKLVDFGYGTVGHLRLLASLGATAVGVEVDPLLQKLYSHPDDQGEIVFGKNTAGHLKLVHGSFPSDAAVTSAVGEGYDLFISKNTLKNGYIHPEQQVDPRMLVHLGVDDTSFVRAVRRVLKPGGLAMIYNLSPAPSPPGKPYKPWADGRTPFARGIWEQEGFEVLEFDRDDSEAARTMGHALGWDQGQGAMDLQNDLFAHWTLVKRGER